MRREQVRIDLRDVAAHSTAIWTAAEVRVQLILATAC
jgi:hypothetical protein